MKNYNTINGKDYRYINEIHDIKKYEEKQIFAFYYKIHGNEGIRNN